MPKVLLYIFLFVCFNSTTHAQKKLTLSQKQADLDFLNKHLRRSHPSYYYHTPKLAMDAYYDSLKIYLAKISDSLSLSRAVRKAVAKVGCGHMSVDGGGKSIDSLLFFPLKTYLTNNKLYVKEKYLYGIEVGDEITRIENMPTQELIPEMLGLKTSDGQIETGRSFYFNSLAQYFFFLQFGQKLSYHLEIKKVNGEIIKLIVPTILSSTTFTIIQKTISDSSAVVVKGDRLNLLKTEIPKTLLIGYDSFSSKRQRATLRRIFKYIKANETENLIVDLRQNGGGSVFEGSVFLKYLLPQAVFGLNFGRKPSLMPLNPSLKISFGNRIAALLFLVNPLQYPSRNGWMHLFPFVRKYRNHFNKKLFVLTSGYTFSMAGYVSSRLKNQSNAITIGQETGASENISNGMATAKLVLPNSKMQISFNLYRLAHVPGMVKSSHGVLPNYPIEYSLDDKLLGKDIEMEKVKELIKLN